MYKTLKSTLKVETTITKNHILKTLLGIPFFNSQSEKAWKGKGFLNGFSKVIAWIFLVLEELLPKFFYILICIQVPFSLYKIGYPAKLFTGQLFTLTLAGIIGNNNCPNGTYISRVMIRDLHTDPGRFTVAKIVEDLFFNFVGLFLASYFLLDTGFLNTLVVTAGIVSGRLVNINYRLQTFKMGCKNRSHMEIPFAIIMVALSYIPPLFGFFIPIKIAVTGFITLIILGISSIPAIRQFNIFREYEIKKQKDYTEFLDATNTEKSIQKEMVKKIAKGKSIRKRESGLTGIHLLFVERYRKMIIKPTLITSAVIIGLTILSFVFYHFQVPMISPKIISIITLQPGSLIVPALLSGRGEKYCRTIYTGFDRSMLHYSFMKDRKNIMKLFLMRFKTLLSINLISGVTFTISLEALLLLSGKFKGSLGLSLALIILSCTLFISIHRILMYFIFMPYKNTDKGEKPGRGYALIENLIFFMCVFFVNLKIEPIHMAILVTVISIIYLPIALLLIHYKGQKTFIAT